ncbi:DUF1223 domain-containing protein [Pseudoflavitalea rhizosphaerae]|uniref:DUF1223 domain-containing protein n=1 Tax=Pseudoflavitalea rhizosphaerae TaxID=1884793 RepID=UPI000F8C72F7|nr:DUF1223 domain-containing protein [Pseudoflavitalea rhizosphaerae]
MEFTKQNSIAKTVALSFVLGIASCTQAQNSTPSDTAPGKAFVVIELFTSEGCSSCPPADKLIEQLQEENPNAALYILAYHVDYWDHQGWKDRFSSRAYSNRQQQYVNWLNLSSLYTPQIVVNGQSENVGSDEGATVNAINNALSRLPQGNLSLTISKQNDVLEIGYQFDGDPKGNSILLALVQKKAESNVTAGENTGRHLPHVQIVRAIQEEDARSQHNLQIKTPAGYKPGEYELIAFVQNKKTGKIITANKSNFNQ